MISVVNIGRVFGSVEDMIGVTVTAYSAEFIILKECQTLDKTDLLFSTAGMLWIFKVGI